MISFNSKFRLAKLFWIPLVGFLSDEVVALTSEEIDATLESPGLTWIFDDRDWMISTEEFVGGDGSSVAVDRFRGGELLTTISGDAYIEFWAKMDDPGMPGIGHDRVRLELDAEGEGFSDNYHISREVDWFPIRMVLPGDGEKVVEIDVSRTDYAYLDKMRIVPRRGFNFEAFHGSISFFPEKEKYDNGELVTLTATPDTGWLFSHWETSSGRMNNAEITVPYSEFEGYYNAQFVKSIELLGWSFVAGGTRPFVESESGDLEAGHFNSDQWIETLVEGPMTLLVSGRLGLDHEKFANGELSIYVEDQRVGSFQNRDTIDNYFEFIIPITAGEQKLRLEFIAEEDGEPLLVINRFEMLEGYSIQLEEAVYGHIQMVPEKRTYLPGEMVTVRAIPDAGYRFAGWHGSARFLFLPNAPEIQIPMNDFWTISATFFEESGGDLELFTAGSAPWKQGDRNGGGENTYFLVSGQTFEERIESILYAEVHGPGTLGFHLHYSANPEEFLSVDDVWQILEETDYFGPLRANFNYYEVPIGEGVHQVKWVAADKSGYAVFEPYFLGQNHLHLTDDAFVEIDPYLQDYSLGQEVMLTAKEGANRRFYRWSGDVDSLANPLILTMDRPYRIEPRFLTDPVLSSFHWRTGGGIDGFLNNVEDVVDSGGWYGTASLEKEPAWLEADIEGPGVLEFSIELTRNTESYFQFYFDGKPTRLQNTDFRDPQIEVVGIPEGTHTLRWEKSYSGIKLNDFKFSEGYSIVSVNSDGATILVTPEKTVYSHNELFSLEAVHNKGHNFLHWKGDLMSKENPYVGNLASTIRVEAVFGSSLENGGRQWWSSGDHPWSEGTLPGETRGGIKIDNQNLSSESWVETTFEGPAVIRFNFFRDANECDILIDGRRYSDEIPYGWSEREILLEKGRHYFRVIANTGSGNKGRAAIADLEYLPGYLLRIKDTPFGVIQSNTGNGVHPPGSLISLSHSPDPGYAFYKWLNAGWPAEFPQTFKLDRHVDLIPLFAPLGLAPGLTITDISNQGSWGWMDESAKGWGVVFTNTLDAPGSSSVELQATGPAVLSFFYGHSDRTYALGQPRVFLNDVLVAEMYESARFYERRQVFVPIPEGVHRIRIQSTASENDFKTMIFQDFSLKQGVYHEFGGEDLGLIAIGTGFSIQESTNEVQEGEYNVEFSSQGSPHDLLLLLPVHPEQENYVFKSLAKRYSGELFSVAAMNQKWTSLSEDNDWDSQVLFFKDSKHVYWGDYFWVLRPDGQSSRILLDGYSTNAGVDLGTLWAGGTVSYEPGRSVFDFGETVTATAEPAPTATFLGWVGQFHGTSSKVTGTVTLGEKLEPLFGYPFEFAGLNWYSIRDTPVEIDYESIQTRLRYSDACHIRLEIEGPGRLPLSWELKDYGPNWQDTPTDLKILMDGKLVVFNSGTDDALSEHSFMFSEGSHTLDLIVENEFVEHSQDILGSLVIKCDGFEPGIFVNLADGGGELAVSPEKEVYEIGDEIHISLVPPDYDVFMGWQGTFSGNDLDFKITLEDHVQSHPIFLKTFDYFDYTFETTVQNSWDLSADGVFQSSDPSVGSLEPSILRTRLDGPGILRFRYQGQYDWDDLASAYFKITVGGEVVGEIDPRFSFLREFETLIPPGTQLVEFLFEDNPLAIKPANWGPDFVFISDFEYDPLLSRNELGILNWLYFFDTNLEVLANPLWMNSDMDQDGVMAVDEMIFGSNPFAYDPVFFEQGYIHEGAGKVAPYFNFSRNKLMGANTMFLQASSNLTDWETLPPSEYRMEKLSENDVQEVLSVEIIPPSDLQRFYRFVYF